MAVSAIEFDPKNKYRTLETQPAENRVESVCKHSFCRECVHEYMDTAPDDTVLPHARRDSATPYVQALYFFLASYRGTSLIRKRLPPRTTIGCWECVHEYMDTAPDETVLPHTFGHCISTLHYTLHQEGRSKATWERELKFPRREAGPPNHHGDKVDSDL